MSLSHYESYIGFDVSETAVDLCRRRFANDRGKKFYLLQKFSGQMADAVLSLDVIYHLVEDDVFQAHMEMLFDAARHFVIIYSSNENQDPALSYTYIRHRNFLRWVEENANGWKLEEHVPNAFPFKGDVRNESFADFYVFSRASS